MIRLKKSLFFGALLPLACMRFGGATKYGEVGSIRPTLFRITITGAISFTNHELRGMRRLIYMYLSPLFCLESPSPPSFLLFPLGPAQLFVCFIKVLR